MTKADGFHSQDLTAAVNRVPLQYGRISGRRLFRTRGVRTTTVVVERKNGRLTLIPVTSRGARGMLRTRDKRDTRTFDLDPIKSYGLLRAEDIQDRRAFGTDDTLVGQAQERNELLIELRRDLDITKEYHKVAAMRGLFLDADGAVLLNYFTEFGVTEKEVNFSLDTTSTDVINKCNEVTRHVEENLLGDTMEGVGCQCSREFFESINTHDEVKAYHLQNPTAAMGLVNGVRTLEFGGILFEEYNAQAKDPDGNNQRFIPANEARFYPLGATNLFEEIYGPADWWSAANLVGQPFYAREYWEDTSQTNRRIDVESYSLSICKQPEALVKGLRN